jgi:hypothetical protein
MLHVTPSDMNRLQLYKTIENKVDVAVGFRSGHCDTMTVPQSTTYSSRLSVKTAPENPRHVIVALQTGKNKNQLANASICDHCDLKICFVMLNQERFPAVDYDLSFPNCKYFRLYKTAAEFSQYFYGMDELVTQSGINPSDHRDLFPTKVFDVSKQSERLKSSVVDLQVKLTFNTSLRADTQAYALDK